jgi:hypothetical protein
VTRTLCGFILLFAIGCSSSPTAPTPAEPPTQSGPPALQLQWVAAASCAPVTMPPSQPPFSSASITQQADGSVTAAWPIQTGTRAGLLHARFVNEGNVLALCSWDIADV